MGYMTSTKKTQAGQHRQWAIDFEEKARELEASAEACELDYFIRQAADERQEAAEKRATAQTHREVADRLDPQRQKAASEIKEVDVDAAIDKGLEWANVNFAAVLVIGFLLAIVIFFILGG